MWWGVVIRICVALTAVLYQEAGVVPGHADNTVGLMQQYMGQHAPVAVHHYHLSICSTKQHLAQVQKTILMWTLSQEQRLTLERGEKNETTARKKNKRNGHKWVEGDKQGQLHIHGLKVC